MRFYEKHRPGYASINYSKMSRGIVVLKIMSIVVLKRMSKISIYFSASIAPLTGVKVPRDDIQLGQNSLSLYLQK